MKSKLLVVSLLSLAVLAGCGQSEETDTAGQAPAMTGPLQTVEITASGFVPAELNLGVGTTVNFVNKDEAEHWPASGVHPTHQVCPGFDAMKPLKKGESYSYAFSEAKECPFHDHLNPGLKGKVTVK